MWHPRFGTQTQHDQVVNYKCINIYWIGPQDERWSTFGQPPTYRDKSADPWDLQPSKRGLWNVPVFCIQGGSRGPSCIWAETWRWVLVVWFCFFITKPYSKTVPSWRHFACRCILVRREVNLRADTLLPFSSPLSFSHSRCNGIYLSPH